MRHNCFETQAKFIHWIDYDQLLKMKRWDLGILAPNKTHIFRDLIKLCEGLSWHDLSKILSKLVGHVIK